MTRWLVVTLGLLCVLTAIAQAANLTCTGTEPFWELKITDSSILLQDGNKVTGQSKMTLKSVKPRPAAGAEPSAVQVYEAVGAERNAKPVTIVVQKRQETKCSNGMSDPIYAYDVIVVTPRVVLMGCCDNK
jgi:uncharacterized membrane protein